MERRAALFHDGRGVRPGPADTSIGLADPKAIGVEAGDLGQGRGRAANCGFT